MCAGDRLETAGNGVSVVRLLRRMNPDIVIHGARVAAAQPVALRKTRPLAGQHIVDAAVGSVVRNNRDLAAGVISREAARDVYGVIEAAGTVDPNATEAKRRELRQDRLARRAAQ